MSRAVYCVVCGRPTTGHAIPEGYRIRVHRRADKPKDPLVLCSGWKRSDHVPILLAREQALAQAMDEEEDIRSGSPDDRTIVATEIQACIAHSSDDQEFILVRFQGVLKDQTTSEVSGILPTKFLDGFIAQLQHLAFHLHKPETN
jgi:hypothetical protein